MLRKSWFVDALAKMFNQLINEPDLVITIPELFEFRLACIPKDVNDPAKLYRPISIQESVLNLLHRALLHQIQKPTSKYQFGT
jgi:hypothetical protein